MHLVTQAALGSDTHHVTDHQHPDDQLGIDGGAAEVAVERAQRIPKPVTVKEQIDLPQHVIGWDVPLQIEVVEQLRRYFLPAHHREILPSPQS